MKREFTENLNHLQELCYKIGFLHSLRCDKEEERLPPYHKRLRVERLYRLKNCYREIVEHQANFAIDTATGIESLPSWRLELLRNMGAL